MTSVGGNHNATVASVLIRTLVCTSQSSIVPVTNESTSTGHQIVVSYKQKKAEVDVLNLIYQVQMETNKDIFPEFAAQVNPHQTNKMFPWFALVSTPRYCDRSKGLVI